VALDDEEAQQASDAEIAAQRSHKSRSDLIRFMREAGITSGSEQRNKRFAVNVGRQAANSSAQIGATEVTP
jgi:hypothetical protein